MFRVKGFWGEHVGGKLSIHSARCVSHRVKPHPYDTFTHLYAERMFFLKTP